MTSHPLRCRRSGPVSIDADLLRRLYLDERLTTSHIASSFGCGGTTIRRLLQRLSIGIRPRGPVPGSRARVRDFTWNTYVAYAVGLMATDGNLSPRRGSMSFVSKDLEQVETLRRCLALHAPVAWSANGSGRRYRKVQWTDPLLYEWFLGIGLTPAKSLTLGPLAVPDEYFAHFFRGCIDGDGSIAAYMDRYNTFKSPTYVYQRVFLSIVSASARFLQWIRGTVRRLIGASGSLTVRRSPGRSDLWKLKYAKRESLLLLRWMYADVTAPSLSRKRDIAERFLVAPMPVWRSGPGRPVVT